MVEPLQVGVTYLPAATGIHMWQEFVAGAVEDELATIRSQGFSSVRVHLAWDAFMPSHRQVDPRRITDFGTLLDAAHRVSLRVVPVLFAQSHGDCVQLPGYAIDGKGARPGVRVVCEGRVRPGGPRDMWGDPLMLEVCELWLRTMLDAFANHPAVAWWDLGHDPATTVRPRRTPQMGAWVELFAGTVRARDDMVGLTLGAGDVLTARGVRLDVVAPHVHVLGLVVTPRRLAAIGQDTADAAAAAFTLQLAMRLAAHDGGAVTPPVHVVTGVAVASDEEQLLPAADPGAAQQWDLDPLAPPVAAQVTAQLCGRLRDSGTAGLWADDWCVHGRRVLAAPPCDRLPSLAFHGLASAAGDLRPHGEVWAALAEKELESMDAAPWPEQLDVESYYRELPDSARDLYGSWRGERAPDGGVDEGR